MTSNRIRYRLHFMLALWLYMQMLSACVSSDSEDGRWFTQLPSSYETYLDSKLQKIRALEDEEGSHSFIFVTDTHLSANSLLSPKMIHYLCTHARAKDVVWGGDAIPAYTKENSPDACREAILSYWNKHQTFFSDSLGKVARVYPVRGNHELTIKMQSKSSEKERKGNGYTFSQEDVKSFLCGQLGSHVSVSPFATGCYYFFDDEASLMRYLILDGTANPVISGSYAWGNDQGMGISDEEFQWVKQHALKTLPEGYALMVFNHEGLTMNTYPHQSMERWFGKMRKELEALANGTEDYAERGKTDIVVCSGHKHQDLQCFMNGILHVGTACDAYYQDYRHSPFFNDVPRREKDGATGCLFDYVISNFSQHQLHCIRIGAGFDRHFNLEKVCLKMGESTKLSSRMLSPNRWRSCDSAGNSYSYSTKQWTLSNQVVNVMNGKVKAVKKGESIVFAEDAEGNKEFWYLVVTQ